MLPKGLLIALITGVVAGPVLGYGLYSQSNHDQLQFVEGSAVSIVTEKFDFKKGEQVLIKIINSGTVPLVFSDASYGLRITGLDGVLYYTPVASQVISSLEPMGEPTFAWDQQQTAGSDMLQGTYIIVPDGLAP